MKKFFPAVFLCVVACSAPAQEAVLQDGVAEFPLAPDSLKAETTFLAGPLSNRSESEPPTIQPTAGPEITKIDAHVTQVKPEVLLIPTGQIKTSYSGKPDHDPIFLLKRSINLTQLQYKSEAEYVPISAQQTVDRIQFFLAQTVQTRLSSCGVGSEVANQEVKEETNIVTAGSAAPQPADYLYQVDLGVSRLVVSNTLLGTSLMGEAEARVTENRQQSRKIFVDSYGGGKVALERFSAESGAESAAELKSATSKVVEFLSNKLGDKLCKYFN